MDSLPGTMYMRYYPYQDFNKNWYCVAHSIYWEAPICIYGDGRYGIACMLCLQDEDAGYGITFARLKQGGNLESEYAPPPAPVEPPEMGNERKEDFWDDELEVTLASNRNLDTPDDAYEKGRYARWIGPLVQLCETRTKSLKNGKLLKVS